MEDSTNKSPIPNSEATQFKPGQSGNPSGREKDPLKGIKNYTKQHIADTFNELCEKTNDELEEISQSKTEPMLRVIIARVMIKAKAKGEYGEIDKILDRCIGKVPQKIEGELGGFGGAPLPTPHITYISVSGTTKPA